MFCNARDSQQKFRAALLTAIEVGIWRQPACAVSQSES